MNNTVGCLMEESVLEDKKSRGVSPFFLDYFYFDKEWRKPLTYHEYRLFKLLCQLPLKTKFKTKSNIYGISHFRFYTKFITTSNSLERKGYIKVDQFLSYKKKTFSIRMNTSWIRIYCLSPEGKVVNEELINEGKI